MKLRILGCGTSSGVPRIGNDWGACDPTEPRNRRTRASILIEHEGTRILVDTGPDMREQLLAADIATVDAIIWTHSHADHINGIDDVRQIFHALGRPVPAYARPDTLDMLHRQFEYVFKGKGGYPPTIDAALLPDRLEVGGVTVRVVEQPHGHIVSAGLRFEAGGCAIGYATDFHDLTPPMADLYSGLDVWVVDALREKPHPSHPTLSAVLGWVETLRPSCALLVHMDQSMDYRHLRGILPTNVAPGYDGMEVQL
ncbi:phosphoribosyl 1,2-cyclic phosphate phosphodiesterase [Sphingomonas gellani]|uniref:Phosphoribosyl 1,2-cyclic phosphate phosphodiesterase n=1 Tax=Sphingomonas gellani TaxID=1166340 RepID=A0A1H7ZP10_9SPHN|nr:MBL fold metallo-hydrolase [Sphingomonas gellani]SEM60342.1 phosphoribosyl 1,2-cyclic phosphate phosphodiesterase [Sphingomonas gellani]